MGLILLRFKVCVCVCVFFNNIHSNMQRFYINLLIFRFFLSYMFKVCLLPIIHSQYQSQKILTPKMAPKGIQTWQIKQLQIKKKAFKLLTFFVLLMVALAIKHIPSPLRTCKTTITTIPSVAAYHQPKSYELKHNKNKFM